MRLVRVALRTALAVSLAVATASCAEERIEVGKHPGVLMSITVETGDRVVQSGELVATLAGDLMPSNSLRSDAACQNMQDWTNDVTLNNTLVVATSPRFVRAAELVESGEFPAKLIALVEQQILKGSTPKVTDAMEQADFGQTDLDAVLVALAEPPAPESLDRFVVYAASSTTTLVRISFLDTAALPKADTDGRDREIDVYVARADVLLYQQFDSDDCT